MRNTEDANKIANTEILNIIKKIGYEYSSKLPTKFIEYLMENSIEDEQNKYTGFDENGNIKVSPIAEEMLDYLNMEYWATEEEKKELLKIYENNEKILNEKYNYDNLFKNKKHINEEKKEETSLITVPKKSKISIIFEKIKQLLKIKGKD